MKIQRLAILLVSACLLVGFGVSVFAQADQVKIRAKNLKKKLESESNGTSKTNTVTNPPAVKPAK